MTPRRPIRAARSGPAAWVALALGLPALDDGALLRAANRAAHAGYHGVARAVMAELRARAEMAS